MVIPESLSNLVSKMDIWCDTDEMCGVSIYCGETEAEKVRDRFIEIWKGTWADAVADYNEDDYVVEECSGSTQRFPGNNTYVTDYGVECVCGSLTIHDDDYDWCDFYGLGGHSLTNALDKLKKEFPAIKFHANIYYTCSIENGGEDISYEYTSGVRKNTPCPIVGKFLGTVEWEEIFDPENDLDDILDELPEIYKFLYIYRSYLPDEAFDLLLEAVIRNSDVSVLAEMSKKITKKNIDRLIETAQEADNTEMTAWLMNYKNEKIGYSSKKPKLE